MKKILFSLSLIVATATAVLGADLSFNNMFKDMKSMQDTVIDVTDDTIVSHDWGDE